MGRALAEAPRAALVAPDVVAAMRQADLVVLNLECCISDRGRPGTPRQAVLLRASPKAVKLLTLLGVDCVTLGRGARRRRPPADFAAGPGRPGVAFADLGHQVPGWLLETIREADADAVVVTPPWDRTW